MRALHTYSTKELKNCFLLLLKMREKEKKEKEEKVSNKLRPHDFRIFNKRMTIVSYVRKIFFHGIIVLQAQKLRKKRDLEIIFQLNCA